MVKILALDPSSTHVGWAIFDYRGDPYDSGVIKPCGKPDERIRKIVEWADELLRHGTYSLVVIEEPAANNAHRNPKTDRLLARVGGAIEAVAILHGAEVARVWPSQVKATGVSKDHLEAAAALTGRKVGPDEADAIGVGLAYLSQVAKEKQE